MDLDSVIQRLSEITGISFDVIKSDVDRISLRDNCDYSGAVAIWKKENNSKLPRDESLYFGRVLKKLEPKQVNTRSGPNVVQNIYIIARAAKSDTAFIAESAIWGEDRIADVGSKLIVDAPVSFTGGMDSKKRIVNIQNVINVTEETAPKITDVSFKPIDTLKDVIKSNVTVHGWVTRIIAPRDSPSDILGFEMGEMEGLQGVSVWFGSQFSKMTQDEVDDVKSQVRKGVEVIVHGYVSGTSPDIKINATSIIFS